MMITIIIIITIIFIIIIISIIISIITIMILYVWPILGMPTRFVSLSVGPPLLLASVCPTDFATEGWIYLEDT